MYFLIIDWKLNLKDILLSASYTVLFEGHNPDSIMIISLNIHIYNGIKHINMTTYLPLVPMPFLIASTYKEANSAKQCAGNTSVYKTQHTHHAYSCDPV